jgi:GABA permease
VIAGSQLILRRRMGAAAKDLQLKMWLFPYLTWVAIVSIVALLVGMVVLESTRESLLLSLALAAVVVGVGLWRYRRNGKITRAAGSTGTDAGATGTGTRTGTSEPAEDATVGAGPAS